MAWNYPVNFDSKQPFWACVVSPLTNRVFSFLCPCHNYSLRLENDCVFTLFLLGVNSSTGAHVSLYLRECKGEDDTFMTFNMEPTSLLPENYILLGRKKVGLTCRWLFLNEENDLIRKKSFYAKWTSKKRGPKRQSLYMICNNLSFDSCQCCCLTMGSMWWGVSKRSVSSLSPFWAGFHQMPAFWSV